MASAEPASDSDLKRQPTREPGPEGEYINAQSSVDFPVAVAQDIAHAADSMVT